MAWHCSHQPAIDDGPYTLYGEKCESAHSGGATRDRQPDMQTTCRHAEEIHGGYERARERHHLSSVSSRCGGVIEPSGEVCVVSPPPSSASGHRRAVLKILRSLSFASL